MTLTIQPPGKFGLLIAIALITALLLSSCSTISPSYAQADAETYRALAPEYLDYLREDESLAADERELALASLDTWRARLIAAGINAASLPAIPAH